MGLSDPEEAVGKTDFDFYDEEFARGAADKNSRHLFVNVRGHPDIHKHHEMKREIEKTKCLQ